MTQPLIIAIISASVTLLTLFLTTLFKNPLESKLHLIKLKLDNEYEQRKETKKIISKFKMQLINSAEYLNHRLWNLHKNCDKNWHNTTVNTTPELYYFKSFIYRICRLFTWIKIIERELVFIDTTYATQEDLDFIKFLKTLPQHLQDTDLLEDLNYDVNIPTDHIYRDVLDEICEIFIVPENNEKVISFSKFKELYEQENFRKLIKPVSNFIDGISPTEIRHRWDMLYCFHFTLLAFLNQFGYDFQQTSPQKLEGLVNCKKENKIYFNYMNFIARNKLNENKYMLEIINLLPKKGSS